MKARVFLYLFLFAFLYNVYQFMNSKRYVKEQEKLVHNLTEEVDSLKAQLASTQNNSPFDENRGFSLRSNSHSREFFENQGISVDSIIAKIESKIIAQNSVDADNPLVPYSGMKGKMRINRVKVLNNRWVMAEFTDGVYWGNCIISYYLDEHNKLQFDTLDGVLYSK